MKPNNIVSMVFLSLIVSFQVFAFSPGSSAPLTKKVEIETRILDFDPQSGMKSRQIIIVNFTDRKITSSYKTGATEFFGIKLSSVRNNFKVVNKSFSGNNKVKFTVVGETASGVGVIPNINYRFVIALTAGGAITVMGCHDGYPAYKVKVDGKVKYAFRHKSKEVLNLFGECDIRVSQ